MPGAFGASHPWYPVPMALELLAPARNADQGILALRCGADAVYMGGPRFGARQAA